MKNTANIRRELDMSVFVADRPVDLAGPRIPEITMSKAKFQPVAAIFPDKFRDVPKVVSQGRVVDDPSLVPEGCGSRMVHRPEVLTPEGFYDVGHIDDKGAYISVVGDGLIKIRIRAQETNRVTEALRNSTTLGRESDVVRQMCLVGVDTDSDSGNYIVTVTSYLPVELNTANRRAGRDGIPGWELEFVTESDEEFAEFRFDRFGSPIRTQ